MHGTIISWTNGQHGMIRDRRPDGTNVFYFLHISRVTYSEDVEPRVGDNCIFDVSSVPRQPGKCASADNARCYHPTAPVPGSNAATAALSGRSAPEPSAADASANGESGAK